MDVRDEVLLAAINYLKAYRTAPRKLELERLQKLEKAVVKATSSASSKKDDPGTPGL